MNLLQLLTTAGYSKVHDEDKRRTIKIVNTLSLVTAAMSGAFGLGCFITTGNVAISAPAVIECSLLSAIILMNGLGQYTAAGVSLIIINNVSIQYYSAIMGRVTEVHLLFIFLVGLSLLVFEKDKPRRVFSIAFTIFAFLIGEINMYNGFISPVVPPEDHTNAQFIIRWVTIPSILILDLLVIYYYVRNIERLRMREMLHVQEMLDTVKEHNRDLEILTAQLAKATDAKTVFVRETSHEIRTPLNAIFGISQLLQLKVEQDRSLAPIRQLADHLYAASYNTRDIINNVLEFSRIEAGKLDTPQAGPLNVKEWMEGIINMHQYVASVKTVKVKATLDPEIPQLIMGDKILLTKTLNNLLSNAIKFTRQESTVTLDVFQNEYKWCLQVTDQGEGISTERQSTIFDAFVTERNIFLEGTGLGLHITRHLVTSMGGEIKVYSKIGKGTTFTVILPLKIPSAICNNAIDNDSRSVALTDTSILIIEDDKMSQMVLSRFLSGMGSRIILAADGLEGLLLARASRPDIIILDSHIPGMSGKDTLAQIRTDDVLKNVPVIIASGDAFKENSEELLQAGANEYLVKPIDFKVLHSTLSKYLRANAHP
ncbi:ATP-binding protein [Chitinophaga ginsengisoli]|uniref:histidine kinase n=1 Tax=Chitinophaga ginsengisoli TaxID=363837 RepID=A0A2P8G0U7_9BACT|nr:ATP-binding protein [Chitinophaga ginsengisoli]PSL27598.1 signal transduction histidine kinase [Chitinophaga ginsengisoli]